MALTHLATQILGTKKNTMTSNNDLQDFLQNQTFQSSNGIINETMNNQRMQTTGNAKEQFAENNLLIGQHTIQDLQNHTISNIITMSEVENCEVISNREEEPHVRSK